MLGVTVRISKLNKDLIFYEIELLHTYLQIQTIIDLSRNVK